MPTPPVAGFSALAAALSDQLAVSEMNKNLLKVLRLCGVDGRLTFAGRAVADANDLPGVAIVRNGTTTVLRDVSLLACVEKALAAFDEAEPDVPRAAFSQALAEAFATRSWMSTENVIVSFGPDGVQVRWPSQETGCHAEPALATLFSLLEIGDFDAVPAETYARAYRGLPACPQLAVDPWVSSVMLPYSRPREHTEKQEAVIELLRNQETMTRHEIQDAVGLTQPTAVRVLTYLVTEGSIEKLGAGPTTRYRLAAEDDPAAGAAR